MGRGECRFSATEPAARAGICAVMAELAAQGLAADRQGDVQLVLAEVVNNIVEHAYAGSGAGTVKIEYDLTSQTLALSVWDGGSGFTGGSLPSGRPADLAGPRRDLPEGGFGWHLIRRLTSGLSYGRSGALNCLCLRFDLTRPPL